jgi:hypothetical protein
LGAFREQSPSALLSADSVGARKLLEIEKEDWEQTAAIIARFFEVKAEDS